MFWNTQVEVFYTTNNRLGKLLQYDTSGTKKKYERSGIYHLRCPSCVQKYIGQTGRPFHVRFREYLHDYRYMCKKSKFAQHLLQEGHEFGPFEIIMDVVQYANKGRLMDTKEKFYIYELSCKGPQINDNLLYKETPSLKQSFDISSIKGPLKLPHHIHSFAYYGISTKVKCHKG